MTDEEARRLPSGLYRLHWAEGGSSLAAVGMRDDGTPWYAATNWTTARATVMVSYWEAVARVEPIEPVTKQEYAEVLAVFGDRVQDSEVARLAVAREREACASVAEGEAGEWESSERVETACEMIAAAIRARGEP